jgi:hypothetical protein
MYVSTWSISFSSRHTKPVPEDLFRRVEKELFDDPDLTEEEEETPKYCSLYLVRVNCSSCFQQKEVPVAWFKAYES